MIGRRCRARVTNSMSRPARWIVALAAAAVAGLGSGCAVGPNFKAPKPEVPIAWNATSAAARHDQRSEVTTAAANRTWWTSFGDPELTSLIERAAADNLDAKAAVLRLAEARAQRRVVQAALWPSLSANSSYATYRVSETTPTGVVYSQVGKNQQLTGFTIPNPYDQYQLGYDASWEVDLFGRVRRSVEAAKADAQAAADDRAAVQVAVLGDVGRAYADLRGAQARRRSVLAEVAAEQDLASLVGQRRRADLAADADVERAAAALAAAEAQLPPLERQIAEDINQLSLLIAREPGTLKAELSTDAALPPLPALVPVGLPADLVRRRPDVREAEDRLHGATARVGVAVGDLFPRVTLGAQGGYQSAKLSLLTNWASRFLTAGPTIELPVFDAGQRLASLKIADLRMREAALDYRRAVLTALNEADNAIEAYLTEQARRDALARIVAANAANLTLARQQHASGLASRADVLSAERVLLQNERQLDDSTAAASVDLIGVYRALGGGWDPKDLAARNLTPAGSG
jgi:outer membrane protein, multidrug efflux system